MKICTWPEKAFIKNQEKVSSQIFILENMPRDELIVLCKTWGLLFETVKGNFGRFYCCRVLETQAQSSTGECFIFFFDIWNVFTAFGSLLTVGIKRKNPKMICSVIIMALRLYKTKDNLISFFGDTNVLLFMLLIKNSSREIYIWLSKNVP